MTDYLRLKSGLRRLPSFLFLVALLCAASAAVAGETTYTLGAGDRLKVTVFGEPDLSSESEVDGRGIISLPLIGQTQVGGHSLHEAEVLVMKQLTGRYLINPRVSIEVMNYRPFFILGEVNKPGGYPFVNGMTALNAVALAGGFTYRARKDEMMIVRANDPAKKEALASPDSTVLPGDIIRVPERFF